MELWQGFSVESPSRKLGVVDSVLFDGGSRRPSALSVRRGWFARSVRIIDASDIADVDARARRIAVRSDGVAVTF
jgi:hypothetical protein